MNGQITKYVGARGTGWLVRWDLPRVNGQRQRRTKRGFRTKGEASAYLRHVLSEQDKGRPVVRSTETVAQAAEAWLNAKRAAGKAQTTLELWETVLRVHVIPRIGNTKCAALTPEQVEGLYAALALHGKAVHHGKRGSCRTAGITCQNFPGCSEDRHQGLSATMVQHCHAALRGALRRSLGDHAALPTDTSRARSMLPKATAPRVDPEDYWSDAQARAFLAATREDALAPVWALALATGLRRGELAGLRWTDVALDGNDAHLWVRQTVAVVRGQAVVKPGGKSKAAVRKVPLGAVAVEVLREHRQAQREARLAAEPGTWADSGHVFTDDHGDVLHPGALTKAFTKATDTAGLSRVGLHGARHYAITSMLRRGVPVTTVAKIVGHEKPSITFDVYSHAIPDDTRLAAAALDAALGAEMLPEAQ